MNLVQPARLEAMPYRGVGVSDVEQLSPGDHPVLNPH